MLIVKGLFCILACLIVRCAASSFKADAELHKDAVATVFTGEILNWAESGHRTQNLEDILKILALPSELQKIDLRSFVGPRGKGICSICKSVVGAVIGLRRNGTSTEDVKKVVASLCAGLNLQPKPICEGLVEINAPVILYIVDNVPKIEPVDVCGLVLQSTACNTTSEKYKWTVEINEEPPRKFETKVTDETIKIIQITDIHYDPLYEPNGNSHCEDPTCCRVGQNNTNTKGQLAGYWGDYNNCDSPWHAVEDSLDHMREEHEDVDYVYFTGDVIDHGVWETSREKNTESLIKSYDKIKETFPNIPVYPLIGNHEPHPLNLFAPSDITDDSLSTQWVYNLMADIWIGHGWLPENTRQTIHRGGFYTVSPQKGFRVIALNNNVCYTLNWWLIYKPEDPSGQLRWLAETLLEAERNEEVVNILAHIPPRSTECYATWSQQYRQIVNRFSHIITAQYNGHTHFDEFTVFYDPKDQSKPTNVAWNGGSVTPFAFLNPNYKVYTVNANTFAVEDIDNWMYNLTRANETPEKRPEWYKSYSFREEYSLRDLSVEAINEWIVKMSKNIHELDRYHRNFHKHADPVMSKPCDDECLKRHLCNIVTTSANDRSHCAYLMDKSR